MEYIPLLRLKSTEESILLEELDITENIFPLVEVVDQEEFVENINIIEEKFGDIMVDLPLYLSERTESNNKHRNDVREILERHGSVDINGQTNFYLSEENSIIPVVSTFSHDIDYDNLISGFNSLENEFERIAIRIFVFSRGMTDDQIENLNQLANSIRNEDILLLDLLEFEDVMEPVISNISEINNIFQHNNTYLLNAFDVEIDRDVHNYTPVLAKSFGFNGFGDFATIPRWEGGYGYGGPGRRIIRFYAYNDNRLVHFVHEDDFTDAVGFLKDSIYWEDAQDDNHPDNCNYCNHVDNDNFNRGPTWWKKYRIIHYINSIYYHTFPEMDRYTDPEDFDMDGYHDINKKTNNILDDI